MKRILLAAALAAFAFPLNAQMMSPGSGHAPGPRFDAKNTPGWALMTKEDRQAHHDKMMSMKDYAECQAYMDEHVKAMEARAKEKGKKLAFKGPGHSCEFLKKKS